MSGRLQRPTLVIRTGIAACILILAAEAACFVWICMGVYWGERYYVGIEAGYLCIQRADAARTFYDYWCEPGVLYDSWDQPVKRWFRWGLVPGVYPGNGLTSLHVPLWIPLVLVAIPTARRWRSERRSRGPGYCATCGYDLRGTPERCPECGKPAEASTRPAATCA